MKYLFSFIFVTLATLSLHAKTLNCVGTEPFWSASINLDNGTVKISDPDSGKGISLSTKIIPAAGTSEVYAFLAKGKYTSLAVVRNENCNDGMSEEKYTHTVLMSGYKNQPYVGCCKE
ncbi:MAG: hypothetical protein ACXWRE_02735 [Pseudobdellovibrionaceae bacterium]